MSDFKLSKTIDLDITDLVGEGDISKIIDALSYYKSFGYEKLYWDGYDSWIKIVDNISEKPMTNPQDPIIIAPSEPITISAKHEWIKCSERLPEENQKVIFPIRYHQFGPKTRNGLIIEGCYKNTGIPNENVSLFWDEYYHLSYTPDYWLPLPEKPE